MAATIHAQNEEMMKQLSRTVEDISKTLVTSGITTNNNIWQHAVMVLNTYQHNLSLVDDFLDLGHFLTFLSNKQHALLFAGIEDATDHKHLLDRYLNEIKKDYAT